MSRRIAGLIFLMCAAVVFSGCFVRTYTVTRDRVDQELTGNRGYIQGTTPAMEDVEKKKKRKTFVVEIEMASPLREAPAEETRALAEKSAYGDGNRGYIMEQPKAPLRKSSDYDSGEMFEDVLVSETSLEPMPATHYTVAEGDTLQKISKRFYGTHRKWQKIYDANQDALKDPNRIKPGIVLTIPGE